MKKLAIGCAVVIVLLGIGGAVATYWVFNKVKSTVSEFSDLAAASKLDATVTNRAPFTPPASGELTADMVAKVMTVQQDVRSALGPRFKEFEARYKDFTATLDRQHGDVKTPGDLMNLVSAYKDLGAIVLAAKKAQVDAINRAGLSAAEYAWTRNQVYAAVGVPGATFNLSEVIDAIQNGRQVAQPDFDPTAPLKAPESNRTLVAPFKDKLMENYPLLIFGI